MSIFHVAVEFPYAVLVHILLIVWLSILIHLRHRNEATIIIMIDSGNLIIFKQFYQNHISIITEFHLRKFLAFPTNDNRKMRGYKLYIVRPLNIMIRKWSLRTTCNTLHLIENGPIICTENTLPMQEMTKIWCMAQKNDLIWI